jgi:hypothetical protein
MAVTPTELDAFYEFARQRLGNGASVTELEDVLSAFRRQRGSCEQFAERQAPMEEDRATEADSLEASVWAERLQRWADGFPNSAHVVDDSRESIYRDDP